MRLPMLRVIFLGIFNRPVFLAFNPSHARVPSINAFSFSSEIVLLETDYTSEALKENINILLSLTGSFLPKPLKTTAHGVPKTFRNLLLQRPNLRQKVQKRFSFFKH